MMALIYVVGRPGGREARTPGGGPENRGIGETKRRGEGEAGWLSRMRIAA